MKGKALIVFTAMLLYAAAMRAAADAGMALKTGAERTDEYLPPTRRAARSSVQQPYRDGRRPPHSGCDAGWRSQCDYHLLTGTRFPRTADAGEHVKSSVDPVTGIPIASLYDGGKRGPAKAVMDNIDVIVTDIQDVGLRYYTYYITMVDLMNAAAKHGKKFMVLDRPNPNGMTVDGPILDMKYRSGVGRLPILWYTE